MNLRLILRLANFVNLRMGEIYLNDIAKNPLLGLKKIISKTDFEIIHDDIAKTPLVGLKKLILEIPTLKLFTMIWQKTPHF